MYKRYEVRNGTDMLSLRILNNDAEVVFNIHYDFDSIKSHDPCK